MFSEHKKSNKKLFFFNTLLTIIKQSFKISKNPFPWTKAISAAVCAGFPVIIGILTGQLRLGLLGGVGSFSYLYVFNEPYAQRAKKVFFVALGISLSVTLGTLVSPYPWLVVLLVGFIGAVVTFIFGVLKIPGPAAVFFILSFIMTTGMPIDTKAAPARCVVVFLSGMFSWAISMIGYFFKPHAPELKAIRNVYSALDAFSKASGSENVNAARNRAVNALNEAEEALLTGYIPWKNSFLLNRLFLLNEQANELFLEMLELFSENIKIPVELSEMIRKISISIELADGETIKIDAPGGKIGNEYNNFLRIIYDAEAIINLPLVNIGHVTKVSKPSLKRKFVKAFDRDSIVFINAVRYGLVLSISAIIAFSFNFTRSYWIPLSCAAVMLGSTVMSTFYRSIQRSIGTIIGVLIAMVIFSLHPQGLIIVIINMCLTTLTELFIVKNYALAAMFITPNALLIAEASTQMNNIFYFASARITDILVGSMIGLIGTYLIGHRSASSRLPDLMIKLIRSQSKALIWMASNMKIKKENSAIKLIEKMEINLINFKTAYNTALGEIPNNEEMLDMLWPAVFSLEHICYLIDQMSARKPYLNLSDKELAQLLLVYETIAVAIEEKQLIQTKNIPYIDEIPKICKEINILQEALSLKNM